LLLGLGDFQRLHKRAFLELLLAHHIAKSKKFASNTVFKILRYFTSPAAYLQDRSVIQYAIVNTAPESTTPAELRVVSTPKPHNKHFKNLEIISSNLPRMQQKAPSISKPDTVAKTLPKLRRHSNQPRSRRCDTKQSNSSDTLRILPQDITSRSASYRTLPY
jgi:hypothetical protein